LIVEYKGADRWKTAEDDREIGQLWASLSNGKCEFIMVNKKDWHLIDTVVEKHDLAEG
jgi:type III restriction enzyme